MLLLLMLLLAACTPNQPLVSDTEWRRREYPGMLPGAALTPSGDIVAVPANKDSGRVTDARLSPDGSRAFITWTESHALSVPDVPYCGEVIAGEITPRSCHPSAYGADNRLYFLEQQDTLLILSVYEGEGSRAIATTPKSGECALRMPSYFTDSIGVACEDGVHYFDGAHIAWSFALADASAISDGAVAALAGEQVLLVVSGAVETIAVFAAQEILLIDHDTFVVFDEEGSHGYERAGAGWRRIDDAGLPRAATSVDRTVLVYTQTNTRERVVYEKSEVCSAWTQNEEVHTATAYDCRAFPCTQGVTLPLGETKLISICW